VRRGFTLAITASADGLKQGVATVIRVKGQASYTLGPAAMAGTRWLREKSFRRIQPSSTKPDAIVDVVLGKQVAMPKPRRHLIGLPAADSPVRGMVGYKPSVEQNIVGFGQHHVENRYSDDLGHRC